MSEASLFDVGPLRAQQAAAASPPVGSADVRRTQRQSAAVAAGYHPLLASVRGYNTSTKVHPDAPGDCSPDAPRGRPYTCGSCRFRVLMERHNRSYPKCLADVLLRDVALEASVRVSHGAATDVRAWWPGCQSWEGGDGAMSPDAARSVPVAAVPR